jgi:radical SAM protein with 4Fe4S-binding SPASM domain
VKIIAKEKPLQYEKHQSFENIVSINDEDGVEKQKVRAIRLLELHSHSEAECPGNYVQILGRAREELSDDEKEKPSFRISPFIADEMDLIDDKDLPRYLYHRYRYDVFPRIRELDAFPPYLQIEPSSICNLRCIFCYQTDTSFSNKKSGYMGSMALEIFKKIVDQAEKNIEFISLSSRGEPTANKKFPEMLDYCRGKFLNLKINTNATLLTEKIIHSLLNGAVKTLVFSADAADKELYGRLRVNSDLDKILRNIEKLQNIREREYPESRVLTRVSGVLVDHSSQSMDSMMKLWGGLVDQISFVKYNPWENVYDSPKSGIDTPCSDLWRRLFIWHDGIANPCDTDYKSQLTVGSISDSSMSELWQSEKYNSLREAHGRGNRTVTGPCNRCLVI